MDNFNAHYPLFIIRYPLRNEVHQTTTARI